MSADWHNVTQGEELLISSGKGGKAFRRGAVLVWALAMGGVVHALVDLSSPKDRKGEKVAYLSIQRGNVKFRPSESILWVDAAMDQAFHDGDTIVTSDRSRAVIKIGDKQRIELGENSMVGLDMQALRGGNPTDGVNLTLYKGNLVAVAKRPAQVRKDPLSSILSKIGWERYGLAAQKVRDDAPVKVKTATKEVTVPSNGTAAYVSKDPKSDAIKVQKAVVVVASEPKAALVKPTAFLIDLAPAKAAVKAVPAPKVAVVAAPKSPPSGPTAAELAQIEADKAAALAAAAATAKVLAEQAEARKQGLIARSMGPLPGMAEPIPGAEMVPVVSPNQSLTLYTGASLKGGDCPSDDVLILVEPQKFNGAKPKSWVPFLDVASSAEPGQKVRVFAQRTKFGKQAIRIPANDVCGLARNPNAVGVSLNLTPGVVFKRGGPDTAGTAASRLFLGSVADFPAMPVTVYLTKVTAGTTKRNGWVPQGTTPAKLQAGAYAVQLKTAQDLPVLFDLIAGSGSFTYNNAPVDGMATKVHLASNGVILATVGAPSYKKSEIRSISNLLDANVAFVGQQSDLIALPKAGVNRIGVLESALAKNGEIQVMSRNRMVTVRNEDVQFNGNQLKVLARNASSAFKPTAKVVLP